MIFNPKQNKFISSGSCIRIHEYDSASYLDGLVLDVFFDRYIVILALSGIKTDEDFFAINLGINQIASRELNRHREDIIIRDLFDLNDEQIELLGEASINYLDDPLFIKDKKDNPSFTYIISLPIKYK